MIKAVDLEAPRTVVRMSREELDKRLHRLQNKTTERRKPNRRELEYQAVLQELEVHQIELEMQNRELRDSRLIIEEAHDRYIDLYDFAPLGYVTLTQQGVMKEINLTAAQMIGIERQWVLGRLMSQWIHPDDLRLFREHLTKCQSATTSKVITRVRLLSRDRKVTLIELSSLTVIDVVTGVGAYRTAISDLTERNKVEVALQSAVYDLKEEKSLREKFVSTLTHDLRTPLTSAKLSGELIMLQEKKFGRSTKSAKKLLRNLDRIENMIDGLLDADRVRAGERIPVSFSHFDLLNLMRCTVSELVEIHGNRFEYINLTKKRAVKGYWSKSGLRRIVENLVNNAVKYGDKDNQIRITISLECSQVLKISVHNQGSPIPAAEQRSLFDQFQRGHAASRSAEKGWGLGLTLVKAMLDAHHGRITLQSTKDTGTTFNAFFPLHLEIGSQAEFKEFR